MSIATRITGKAGVIGTLVGSFACTACFPAIASIGGALGLGFLDRWEGVSVRYLIPLFAVLVLLANLTGWRSHRQWRRTLAGVIGPILALVGAFGLMGVLGLTPGFLPPDLARGVFYVGLIAMLSVALWDLARPGPRQCEPRPTPAEH